MTTLTNEAEKGREALLAACDKLHELGFGRLEDWFIRRDPNDDDSAECIHIDTLAALTAAPQGQAGAWLPIDSRPDGLMHTYLVTNRKGQVAPWIRGVIHNNPGTKADWAYGEEITGWQPLPQPPQESP